MKCISIVVVILGALLLGCQDQLAIKNASKPDELNTKAGKSMVRIDQPYTFLAEKNFKAWTEIVSLEDRLAACEVPEIMLKEMTTDALVRTVLKFPLNFIISAYDNPLDAVDLIVKHSPLHQELMSRRDAAECLLRYFDRTYIDRSGRRSMFNQNDSCLTFSNEVFFEYLLASRLDSGLFSKKNHQEFARIARRKFLARESDSGIFCRLSATPLMMIAGGGVGDSLSRTQTTWIWQTPFGEPVYATQYEEMPNEVRDQLTYDYMVSYPNATLHGMASSQYNGHGYAWIIRDPTVHFNDMPVLYTKAWVAPTQVPTFMSDGFCVTCAASDAERVFYGTTSNHSAIPYPGSSSLYLSKWGNGPLMEHAPAYCPYSTDDLQYFKIRTTVYEDHSKITGPGSIICDSLYTYFFPSLRGLDSWTWSVEANISDYYSFYAQPSSTYCGLNSSLVNLFVITVDGKRNNTDILHSEMIVSCIQ